MTEGAQEDRKPQDNGFLLIWSPCALEKEATAESEIPAFTACRGRCPMKQPWKTLLHPFDQFSEWP